MRQIVHLADIHIGNANSTRTDEYKSAFDRLAVPSDSIVIVAGDIFDYKVKYSGDDLALFEYMLDILRTNGNEVILIPGNHDTNLQNENSMDLISPLVQPEDPIQAICEEKWRAPIHTQRVSSVHYWRSSGIYRLYDYEFIHVSVKCELSSADILKLVPGRILLYHGGVEGIPYADKHLITREIMSAASLTILGDIHERQYFGENAAYCGSLIQQNHAESIEKGYLLWNNNEGRWSSTFVHVPGSKRFILLDFRGKTSDEARNMIENIPEGMAVKTRIKTDINPVAPDILEMANKRFYGSADVVCVPDFSPITTSVVQDHIRNELMTAGISEDAIRKTIDDFMTRGVEQRTSRWYPTRMEWSNYFKYGQGNVLDFRSGIVSGLTAPNCSGKSSILEILALGLFNEPLHGDKKQCVRFGATTADLTIDFVAGGVNYTIKRTDRKTGGAKAALYKDNVDQSQHTQRATYDIVRDLIGSIESFMRTNLFNGRSEDILYATSNMRLKCLPELFGMRDNSAICEPIKQMYSKAKEALLALQIPSTKIMYDLANERAQIAELQCQLADNRAEIENIDAESANQTAKFINQSESSIRAEMANCSITDTTQSIDDLHQEYAKWNSLAMANPAGRSAQEIAMSSEELAAEIGQLASMPLISPSKVLRVDQPTLGQNALSLADALAIPFATPAPYADDPGQRPIGSEINLATYAKIIPPVGTIPLQGNLTELYSRLISMPKGKPGIGKPLVPRGSIPKQIQAKKLVLGEARPASIVEADLQQIGVQIDYSQTIQSLNAEKDKLMPGTKFVFNDNCSACLANSAHVSQRLRDILEELKRLDIQQKLYQQYKALTIELQSAKNIEHNAMVDECMDYNAKIIESNQYYDNYDYEEYTKTLNMFYQALQYEINLDAAAKEYDAKWIKYSAYNAWEKFKNAAIVISRAYDARINVEQRVAGGCAYAKRMAEACKAKITAINHNETNRIKYTQLESQLPTAIESDAAKKRYADLSSRKNILEKENAKLVNAIYISQCELDQHEKSNLVLEEYNAKAPVLQQEESRLKKYVRLVESGQIRQLVTAAHLREVISQVNIMLKEMTNFTLDYSIGTGLDISIVEKEGKIDVTRGSGFQRHCISIVFRMVMSRMYPYSGNFLLIDEGFNSFDAQNLSSAANLIKACAQEFKSLIIITHNPDIMAILDHVIEIKIENGVSHVVDGKPTQKIIAAEKETTPDANTYICQCGATVKNKKSSIAQHCKTAKHTKYMTSH